MKLPGRTYSYPYKLPAPWPQAIGTTLFLGVYLVVALMLGATITGQLIGFAVGLATMLLFFAWVSWDDRRTVRRTNREERLL